MCQEVKLGYHLGEPEVSKGVENDWRHQSNIGGDGYNVEQREIDSIMSGTLSDSKQVDPRPLAEREDQH